MTLLVASGPVPLELEIEGQPVTAAGWLLAPELRRRFSHPQPHISITIEPGHATYSRLLAWARLSPLKYQQLDDAVAISELAAIIDQGNLASCLNRLLDLHHQPISTPNPRLAYLLSLIDEADTEITAEDIWQVFRQRYPSTQAHCSHWLQECLGIPLRKLLLWRKLRRAVDMLGGAKPLTEIAHAAGFADSAHLSRICLRTFGLNPSQASDHKTLQASRLPAN
ncbi:MAG TPA: helix-turn-helix domain-containing protein [Pseudomonas sp.]|uniref:helix-turn-helix domain-containing protein n=1 Tax=Pseudomonas sp. TaxID=306 RepID=UPI002C1DE614|nr:helix-turn-helix domain-containing protein [Pseudomonas sp.]HSX91137.1 helix-turn-helix domain-containing protein [Pseudomonas sp.]